MTFSIVARCAQTGMFGVAISSSSIAVGARCPQVRVGIGAASSQNVTNPMLATVALEKISQGMDAAAAMAAAVAGERYPDYRQLLVVDAQGRTAIHSGGKALGTISQAQGVDCVAAGNMLAGNHIAPAMVSRFEAGIGLHLGTRLLQALAAGLAAGGEEGPVHSAALKVCADQPFPLIDLRVDWMDDDPIGELERSWHRYEPQMAAYALRAVNPVDAPSYGVPGDL